MLPIGYDSLASVRSPSRFQSMKVLTTVVKLPAVLPCTAIDALEPAVTLPTIAVKSSSAGEPFTAALDALLMPA